MDTDGTVDERGRCSFTSVSKELAQGVRELVWSLGGKASLKSKDSHYIKDGESVECRVAYKVRTWLPKNSVMFKLSRKKARCTDSWNGGYELSREVVKIEYVGEKEAQCIQVDNPFGLYIADDYIVTHNTQCGRFWLLGLTDDPAKLYIHDKRYKALVLRRNQIDLGDWVDQAKELYGLWGAEYRDRPYPCFVFPSGAKFVLGHLADEDAYEKWAGQEFQRMLIEELTQIPTFRLYWLTVGNCRSPYKELRPQVFLTTNPIGPGTGWVRERFIDVLDKHGKPVPPGQPIEEEFKMPDGRTIVRTRVFIPARLTDNKYLMNDPGYMAVLMGLPPNERRAMLDGDWHALSGVFFETLRPRGPLTGEPPEANHVVDSSTTVLKPWWHRWAAMDWGFSHDTVIQWACHEPDGRVYVTREMVVNKTSPEEVGAEFARRSIEDLRGLPRKSMVLWLPHDAFGQRTEEKTIADQIRIGIEKTLGPNSCYIADADKLPDLEWLDRIDETRDMTVVLRRTIPNRVAGWQFINQMLRWWPIHPATPVEFDRDYALRLLYDNVDPDAYTRYMASIKQANKSSEVLPMLRIFATCPMTIKALQSVVHDPKKPEDILKVEGDDAVDCLSYLCGAFKHEINREPFEAFLEKRLALVQSRSSVPLNGASEFWIAQKAERDWRGAEVPPSVNVVRSSMGRRQNVNTIS